MKITANVDTAVAQLAATPAIQSTGHDEARGTSEHGSAALISQVTAENNRFAPSQLAWLSQAIDQQLQTASGPFYSVSDEKSGLQRPTASTESCAPVWSPRMSDWFAGKTILVTGSSGFIGKYTLDALKARGVGKMIGVDLTAPDPALSQAHKNFVPYTVDILDQAKLREVFETHRPDGVIHLAARAGVPQAEVSDAAAQSYFDVNVKGTDVITQLCHDYGVCFLANAGSSSEFGSQAWDGHTLKPQGESSTLVPEGNYGRTKVFSEMLLSARALGHASADHTLVTTFFNPLGYGERGLLVPLMTRKLLECAAQKSGQFTVYDQYRGYTPVEQTLEHLFRGVERLIDAGPGRAALDYQHCGGGITTNNKVIADLTVEALNTLNQELNLFEGVDFKDFVLFDPDGARQGDVKATYSDKTKAENVLGLTPDMAAVEASVVGTVREATQKWIAANADKI